MAATLLSLALTPQACASDPAVEEPDAAVGPPTEFLTIVSSPEAAGTVVFSSEPNGTLIEEGTIGADGRATILARDGGMLSFGRHLSDLTTLTHVPVDAELQWFLPATPESTGPTINLTASTLVGVTAYTAYGCDNRLFDGFSPLNGSLQLSQDCIEQASELPVVAMAMDRGAPRSYALATLDTSAALPGELRLDWLSDFAKRPVSFEVPGYIDIVEVSHVLRFGQTRVEMPFQTVDKNDQELKEPPGASNQVDYIRMRAASEEIGIQEYEGLFPGDLHEWLDIPNAVAVQHSGGVRPTVRWAPNDQGDLMEGRYAWRVNGATLLWTFITTPDNRLLTMPELPPSLQAAIDISTETDEVFADMRAVDYKDLEGYDAFIRSDRPTASFHTGARRAYLEAGGEVACATAFSP